MRSHNELNYAVNVPFSWEHKPGVSKITHQEGISWHFSLKTKTLPPPPCLSKSTRVSFDDSRVPFSLLPAAAAAFQAAPSKSSFKKVVGYREKPDSDPFLVAYKKCTDDRYVPKKGKLGGDGQSKGRIKMRRQQRQSNGGAASFSCKYSCAVASDYLVIP
ncbi:hypothetical protein GH714_010819 [Hevea brasiliensis]|uniref:Uncharacterized protein n=1 Tax=Hevea brasiliensis TaxID=3981 RepID=A0A6A6NGF5_HEVBR|nr:hypothetical protein GH714_010819 [Hevea brasiliensis]